MLKTASLRQIIANSFWIMLDNIVRIGVGFFVGVWVARYLGPSQYGLWNYAISFVAIFSVIANPGFNDIVIRDVVRMSEKRGEVLGTSFFLRLVGASIASVLAIIIILILSHRDFLTTALVAVSAVGLIFQSFDVISLWFESRVKSQKSVTVRLIAFSVSSAIKVALILSHASLIYFALASIIELGLSAIGIILAYWHDKQSFRAWQFTIPYAKTMLRNCWPIMAAGALSMVYLRVDKILVGNLISDSALGNYSVGTMLTESLRFVAIAITASVFPAIIYSKQQNEKLYLHRLQMLYNFMILMAVVIAVPITIFAHQIIHLLYGDQFSQAATVLSIYIWTNVFMFSDFAASKWFYTENLQKFILYKDLAGAIVSLALDLILIPRIGVIGAAISGIISIMIVTYLGNLFFPQTRIVFRMQTASFFHFLSYHKLKSEINSD
jgi:PST family polysaccharide transporter